MTNQTSDLEQLSAAELRQWLIAAQEENKVLTDLFHTIVFELRTPFAIIESYGHLLLRNEQDYFPPLDKKQTEAVTAMKNNAIRGNEVIGELIDKVTRAKRFENLGASLLQDYRRELQEANQQLDILNVKYQAIQEVLQIFRHEMLEAVHRMMGFSRLFLQQPELMGGPLNRQQLEGIAIIRQSAEHNYEIIKYYFFDLLKTIEVLDKEPEPEAVSLAEIGEMTEFAIESELALETAVSVNRYEAGAIINLLAKGWFQRNRGSVLAVTAVADGTLRFHFPHVTEIRYGIEDMLDGETGRLKFSERQRYFDPVGLAAGLVEKYGGAVYAELAGEGTCHLSFTLPFTGKNRRLIWFAKTFCPRLACRCGWYCEIWARRCWGSWFVGVCWAGIASPLRRGVERPLAKR